MFSVERLFAVRPVRVMFDAAVAPDALSVSVVRFGAVNATALMVFAAAFVLVALVIVRPVASVVAAAPAPFTNARAVFNAAASALSVIVTLPVPATDVNVVVCAWVSVRLLNVTVLAPAPKVTALVVAALTWKLLLTLGAVNGVAATVPMVIPPAPAVSV